MSNKDPSTNSWKLKPTSGCLQHIIVMIPLKLLPYNLGQVLTHMSPVCHWSSVQSSSASPQSTTFLPIFIAHPFQRACTHRGPSGTCHIITLWLHMAFQFFLFPDTGTWDKPPFRADTKTTQYEILFENTECALLVHRMITDNEDELYILHLKQ